MGLLCRRLLNEDLPDSARRLLLFLMGHLRYSQHADVVVASKRFLPGDVGVTAEEATLEYRALHERQFVATGPEGYHFHRGHRYPGLRS